MKKCSLILLFLVSFSTSGAQIEIHPNHIYLEAFGTGGFASLQYERQLFKKTRLNMHGGLGLYNGVGTYYSGILGLNYLYNTKWQNRFIEFGFSMSFTPDETSYYSPDDIKKGLMRYMPNIGFRWYTKKQWVWRVSALLIADRDQTMPWFGFSVGKNF